MSASGYLGGAVDHGMHQVPQDLVADRLRARVPAHLKLARLPGVTWWTHLTTSIDVDKLRSLLRTVKILGPRRAARCWLCGTKRLVQRFWVDYPDAVGENIDICTACLLDALRSALSGRRPDEKKQ